MISKTRIPGGKRTPVRWSLIGLAAVAGAAQATNGYFPHGYGMKHLGMGGASTALAIDSFGGASNPATMVWAGSRTDLGVNIFSPKRDAERSGTGSPLDGKVESDKTRFYVPEFGYNQMMSDAWSVGVSLVGNGGMNTNYPQGAFQCPNPGTGAMASANMLCGGGALGVDLMQLVLAPTVAFKLDERNALGASLLLGYQMFKAYGLQAFESMSSAPGGVTDRGYDSSRGLGLRVGYMGRWSDQVSFGAAYSTKVNMGKLDKYKGLFAEQGDFDIPANYNLGVAFHPTADWTVALDYQRILYSGVASVGHSSRLQAPLGSDGGPGFGWHDVNVVKLGLAWQTSENFTLRAGYNRGSNPVRGEDVSFNILAPGVMTRHYTAGFTYALGRGNEINAALMVAPRQTVSGGSLLIPGAQETVGMKQTSFGIGWGHSF